MHVPKSCGLPDEMLMIYINQLKKEGSPIMATRLSVGNSFLSHLGLGMAGSEHRPSMQYLDSSSNTSSCNSSTPSSPAVLVTSQPTPPHSASVYTKTKFTFDHPPMHSSIRAPLPPHPEPNKPSSPNPVMDSVRSYDSDKTLSGT